MPAYLRRLLAMNGYCSPVDDDASVAGISLSDDEPAGDEDQVDGQGGDADDSGADKDGATDAVAADGEDAPADDEITISIEGEEAPAEEEEAKAAPAWVKDLRKTNRELVRRQRELEAENAKLKNPGGAQPQAVTVGEKPRMDDPAIDFDAEKFEAALEAWHERKRQADEQDRKRQDAERKANEAWQAKTAKYTQAKQSLKVADFEDAEEVVQSTFSTVQQGLLIAAPRSAELIYALGKNPTRAKALAGITDPVEFVWAAGELMSKVKVTTKRSAPEPERAVRSNVPGATVAARELEKLREKAHKTGDMTEYLAAKRRMKEKATA